MLLLAGGKHGAPIGRRRLRRDPRRVRAAATIPSREGGERAGKGHGGEGGAGRPVPRLLRRGCAAAPPGSPELRTPRPPGARIGNKWDRAVGNLPALSAAAAATAAATAAEAPREGGSERRREGRGQRAGEERGQDSGDAPPRGQVGAAPPSAKSPAIQGRPDAPSPGGGASRAHSPLSSAGPRGGSAPMLCKHRVKGKGSS